MDTKSIGVSNEVLHRATDLKGKRAENVGENSNANDASRVSKNFDVNLSQEAQELLQARQKAMQIAKSTSPVREDRIAAIKAQIADGTYKVDPGRIADGMLVEAIKDKVSTTGTEV